MIKSKNGQVGIDGSIREIKADFACIVLALTKYIEEDDLRTYFEAGISFSNVDDLDGVIDELLERRKNDAIRN